MMSIAPKYFVLIPLVLGILSQASTGADEKAEHRTGIFLLLGVAYAASVGGIGTILFAALSIVLSIF